MIRLNHWFLIVIPSFNEEGSIGKVLEGLLSAGLPADILVINDGSKDNTEAVAGKYPVTVISHPCNLGYGAALQTGYKYAVQKGYRYVIQFDADGQHDPADIPMIMEELESGDADIVMGSRFLGEGSFTAGMAKGAGIKFFRMLIRRLTGVSVSDPTSGLRGISSSVFRYFSIRDHFPADFPDADILIQMILMNFRIKEVPAHMHHREAGVSMHAGLKPVLYMLQIMLSICIVMIRHKLAKKVS